MNEKECLFIKEIQRLLFEKYPQQFYFQSFKSDLKYKRIILQQEEHVFEKEWLIKCQKTLDKIHSIITNARMNVKYVKDVKRAEDASKMDQQALQMTIKDSKMWKEKNKGHYSVEFIHTNVIEDNIAIYENKFIKLLIDKLDLMIKSKLQVLLKKIGTVYQFFKSYELSYPRLEEIYAHRKYHHQKMEVLSTVDDITTQLFNQLYVLQKRIVQLKDSHFYKECSKEKDISDNIQMTNIIINEANYNYCYKFFKKLKESHLNVDIDPLAYYHFVILKFLEILHKVGFDEADSKDKNGYHYVEHRLDLNQAIFFKDDVILMINTTSLEDIEVTIFQTNCDERDIQERPSCKLLLKILPSLEESEETQLLNLLKQYQGNQIYDDVYIIAPISLDYFNHIFSVTTSSWNGLFEFIVSLGATIPGSSLIYNKICPVCGSQMISKETDDFSCLFCLTNWTLFKRRNQQYVWIKAKK